MKKLIYFFVMYFVMASCHNYKKDAQNLLVEKDSLLTEIKTKNSSIQDFLQGYNDIQANLDSIIKMENLVNLKSGNSHEMSSGQKMIILEDIQMINDLIQKNKNQIVTLQNRLKNSNAKTEELAAVKLMLTNIQAQNQEKDTQINKLSNEVKNLNLSNGQLSEKITEIETENRQKEQTIVNQTAELNQVFYAIGSNKKLKEDGILEKVGGFLGIGRTPMIVNDFNRENFTVTDKRELDFIPLKVKKAKLLSVHPTTSYHISGDVRADTLIIDNKMDFWKATKYLIVVAD